jgi:hypothetical protein
MDRTSPIPVVLDDSLSPPVPAPDVSYIIADDDDPFGDNTEPVSPLSPRLPHPSAAAAAPPPASIQGEEDEATESIQGEDETSESVSPLSSRVSPPPLGAAASSSGDDGADLDVQDDEEENVVQGFSPATSTTKSSSSFVQTELHKDWSGQRRFRVLVRGLIMTKTVILDSMRNPYEEQNSIGDLEHRMDWFCSVLAVTLGLWMAAFSLLDIKQLESLKKHKVFVKQLARTFDPKHSLHLESFEVGQIAIASQTIVKALLQRYEYSDNLQTASYALLTRILHADLDPEGMRKGSDLWKVIVRCPEDKWFYELLTYELDSNREDYVPIWTVHKNKTKTIYAAMLYRPKTG